MESKKSWSQPSSMKLKGWAETSVKRRHSSAMSVAACLWRRLPWYDIGKTGPFLVMWEFTRKYCLSLLVLNLRILTPKRNEWAYGTNKQRSRYGICAFVTTGAVNELSWTQTLYLNSHFLVWGDQLEHVLTTMLCVRVYPFRRKLSCSSTSSG